MNAQVQDTTYAVIVTMDNNFIANASTTYDTKIPLSEPHITLTAVVRDNLNKLAPNQTVYWSCPRIIVQFFDDGDGTQGNVVTSSVTNEDGEATIHACASTPVIALISASLTPSPATEKQERVDVLNIDDSGPGAYFSYAVFNTISNNTNNYPKILGPSSINISPSLGDNNDNWVPTDPMTIDASPPMTWEPDSLVAVWIAQIDYPNTDISNPVLLGPTNNNSLYSGLVPASWDNLKASGIKIPYEVMASNSAGNLNNIVQYMIQTGYGGNAYIAPWHNFGARGVAWTQPDPDRPQDTDLFLPPVVLNVLKKEEPNPGILNNSDYFISDENGLWLMFHIHTDHLSPGDTIQPWVYVNGYNYNTTDRISNFFKLTEKEVTQAIKDGGDVITIKIAATQIDSYCKSGTTNGHLDVTYLVNQWSWSPAFSIGTDFIPE
ncbi:hypothetical protein DUT91_24320 [Phyllobacterium salinisoli]|uniref:Uncharacterized protein n=1 Tax=Phyllobacterium salinisoli TaxID=1899321 RepID=A0A368JZ20_9HYPH|nr:Ig-like domain-containing protein [Phyllobacterium salinisoli]RCS21412.1 hypothetical protein DUT91_24320 [Phyllobacterium salinisoli]